MSAAPSVPVTRQDVTFTSGGDLCAAWWYAPAAATGTAPCVVMAHGFSMTREDGLAPYAEAFARAGAHVLAFDHRYLGDSGGEPRQRFRAGAQREDWRNAAAFARTLEGVDPARIVLWGFSFSGGHVTTLLASGLDVAAGIALCPFVDGLPRVLATPPRLVAWIFPRAWADMLGHHNVIPVTGPPGAHAAMTFPGESEGFLASRRPGSRWANEISPGIFATATFVRPIRKAGRIRVPLWVGRCAQDVSVDAKAVGRLAERAPGGELHEFPGDHFAPFVGDGPDAIAAAQVTFLRQHVL